MDDSSEQSLAFRRMTSGDRHEAFALLSHLLVDDPYYRDSSEAFGGAQGDRVAVERALAEGLSLFLDRPDYGFVWIAFDGDRAVGCASVGYAISLSVGAVVAKLDYLVVAPDARRNGIGSGLLETLIAELRRAECARVDVGVHIQNAAGQHFYRDFGFVSSNEERLSLVIR